RGGSGPWVVPGQYTVRLSANGTSLTRSLIVKMDPRIKVSDSDLQAQLSASQKAAAASAALARATGQATNISRQLRDAKVKGKDNASLSAAIEKFDQRLTEVAGKEAGGFGAGPV